MVNEAQAHADEDKAAKEKVEVHNKAESMIYQTEKQLEEHKDQISDEIKKPVVDGIEKLKKQLESDDTEGMKNTMQEIEQHLMQFGQQVYEQAQAQQGAAGGQPGADAGQSQGGANDDNIVDAEVVDDDK